MNAPEGNVIDCVEALRLATVLREAASDDHTDVQIAALALETARDLEAEAVNASTDEN